MDRKKQIIQILKSSNKPVSATSIAKTLGVSRQIIVGDVALIRASGISIYATSRGYVIDGEHSPTKVIAVKHRTDEIEDELNIIVDMGGEVIDVIVEHPLYGEIKGNLHLKSRFDVTQFLEKSKHTPLLLSLTEGIHFHTIAFKDEEVFNRIYEALDNKGFIYKGSK